VVFVGGIGGGIGDCIFGCIGGGIADGIGVGVFGGGDAVLGVGVFGLGGGFDSGGYAALVLNCCWWLRCWWHWCFWFWWAGGDNGIYGMRIFLTFYLQTPFRFTYLLLG
jgi:hypothetical protein